ncbi:MAG TPA: MFS transporter [Streptosporangiaceae bacterium]|jgi:EmrB/QacA subfamily drug resistance transporter
MTGTGTPAPASGRSAGLALAVLCGATLMIILDGTIVTVALPAIQRDLGFSAAGLTWVMNAYMIAFGGLLLLAGRLGDLLGRRRMLLAGLALFTAASLACGLSAAPALLITARFAQGAGAAMVSAVSLGMIVGLYSEARPRARAIGAYSFVGAGGASIGLVLGGVLTEALSWHWIFFVNLPVGVAAIAAGRRVLPAGERPAGRLRGNADALGALLVTAGLMTGVYALIGTAQYGWASVRTLGLAAAAVLLIAAFAVREAAADRPLLRLRVLAARRVSGANLAQVLVIAAAFGFQVLIVLYLQRVLHYSPARAGLGLLPTAVVIGMVSLGATARLAARFGERAVLLAGLALVTAALAGLTGLPVRGSYAVHLLPVMLAFGAGGGLTLPALATLGMSDATPADAGVVSGLFNTTQQVGAAIGVALLSTLAAGRSAALAHGGLAPAAALAGGYRLAFAVGAGLAGAAFGVAAVLLRPPPDQARRDSGTRTAGEREPEPVSGSRPR